MDTAKATSPSADVEHRNRTCVLTQDNGSTTSDARSTVIRTGAQRRQFQRLSRHSQGALNEGLAPGYVDSHNDDHQIAVSSRHADIDELQPFAVRVRASANVATCAVSRSAGRSVWVA
jgi:hypothetical protein